MLLLKATKAKQGDCVTSKRAVNSRDRASDRRFCRRGLLQFTPAVDREALFRRTDKYRGSECSRRVWPRTSSDDGPGRSGQVRGS